MRNPRTLLLASAALGLLAGGSPRARADRLGGNYRGPDDNYEVREDPPTPVPPKPGDPPPPESPPDSPPPPPGEGNRHPAGGGPDDGGAPPSPPEGGDSGGEIPPPGTAPTPSAPGSGAYGKIGKGGPHDDQDRIWPFYFESVKEEYLADAVRRRPDDRLSPPHSSTGALSLLPEAASPRRPVFESDRDAAFRLVLGRLRDPDSHVRDAAVLALGKSARADAVPFLRMASDRDPDPAVREDALLALGLSGDRTEALPALLGSLAPPRAGAREKRVAFAALGLGLLGDGSAAEPLRGVLEGAWGDPARAEDAACAATALGMLRDARVLPLLAPILASRTAGDPLKSLALHAAGFFGADPSADVRRQAFEIVRAALEEKPEVRQSALLALGAFPDPAVVPLLVERGILDPDPSCRNFAAHSLGRIAGRAGPGSPGYATAQRELARYADSDRRDRWLFQAGNLALASMACADRERDLVRLAEEMRGLNVHSASSVVISLGILGGESGIAARELREAYGNRGAGSAVQAYAGLALAMADSPGAAEAFAKVLAAEAPPDAAVARTTALALGLVGGAKEADLLVGLLRGRAAGKPAADRIFLLGAAVQGLGIIGDGDTVGKLEPLLAAAEPWTARAFATAALGYLLERDPARRVSPRISGIFRHHNYRCSLPLVRAVEGTL